MNDIEVVQARLSDHSLVANLIEFYVYDFSELLRLDVAENGRFGYEELPRYWSEPDRYVFLIRKGGLPAGFLLLKKVGDVWDIAEFFVLRAYRRQGIGFQTARQVWTRFPGRWRVRVRQQNAPALCFWNLAIAAFLGREVSPEVTEIEGQVWSFFLFESKA